MLFYVNVDVVHVRNQVGFHALAFQHAVDDQGDGLVHPALVFKLGLLSSVSGSGVVLVFHAEDVGIVSRIKAFGLPFVNRFHDTCCAGVECVRRCYARRSARSSRNWMKEGREKEAKPECEVGA